MSEWKDVTTYRKGEEQRIPRSWERLLGNLRCFVTRRHGMVQTKWYLNCEPFFTWRELVSELLDDAKCQAIALVQVELERALKDILKGS